MKQENKAGQILAFVILFLATNVSQPAETRSGMATGGGLAFWIELPSDKFTAGTDVACVMVVSNQYNVSRRFTEKKQGFHDTSIGEFVLTDPSTGLPVQSIVSRGERHDIRGHRGYAMEPHEVIKAGGHVTRTYSLTNAGKYLISAKALFLSTNWNPEPPGESFFLETPPIEIEILPQTNSVPPVKLENVPTLAPPAEIEAPAKTATISKQAEQSVKQKPTAPGSESSASSTNGRNLRFGLLVFLPILIAIGWITWRRTRS